MKLLAEEKPVRKYGKAAKPILIDLPTQKDEYRLGDIQKLIRDNMKKR